MKKLLALSLLCLGLVYGQDVTSILGSQQLALTNSTVALTVTASQGDGTVCTLTKLATSTITAVMKCTSGDGKTTIGQQPLKATGTVTSMLFGMGDVLCILVINPTSTATPVMGSMPAIPATSIGWSCSTNIRTNGSITGQTALTNGSVSWP